MRGWEWWLTSIIPTLWEAEAGVSLEPSLHNMLRPNLYQKVKEKLIQVWWCVPAVPATQEAEVGRPLEPNRLRMQ